ncbi:MAG: hypothetical protein AB7F89_03195 [Pirellulaceae bacterium]
MKTPEGEFLGARRRALEDAFFAERDRQLLERLRNELCQLEEQQHLAHVCGVIDEKVLTDLLASGVRAETLAAVRLIPLVEVAWCDGHVSPAERRALLEAAVQYGIKPNTACHALLDSWLAHRPDPRIVQSWKEYVSELAKAMPADSMQKMRDDLEKYLRTIAQSAGGILGLQRISKKEHDTIDELIRAAQA